MLRVRRIWIGSTDRGRFLRRLLLCAFLSGVILLPFAILVGIGGLRVWLLRAQLQSVADALAPVEAARLARLAGLEKGSEEGSAQGPASANRVTPAAARMQSVQAVPGIWDFAMRRFRKTDGPGNAVCVVVSARTASLGRWGRLASRAAGAESEIQVRAVAAAVPRDIVFLVDLSGRMNDDTEPAWAPAAAFPPGNDPDDSTAPDWLQDLYDDFGFGSYPGATEDFGSPWGIRWSRSSYAELTADGGPLTASSVPERYRILPSDDPPTRRRKAYSAVIDGQIARVMPRALPSPDSRLNFDFWAAYLDYLMIPAAVPASTAEAALSSPLASSPVATANRLNRFRNPDRLAYPCVRPSVLAESAGRIGYRTFVQFMMDFGRDLKPADALPVPLSLRSRDCPLHEEAVPGGVMRFPPREQPMHAVRRALIAALHVILERNAALADAQLQDRVAVVGYDAPQSGGAIVLQNWTADCRAVMQVCSQLQAGCDKPSPNEIAAGLRAGLQTARRLASEGRKTASPARRDAWVILIRYDGDISPDLAAASLRMENAADRGNGGTPAGPSSWARPDRDSTAELIERLRLEGLAVHAFTVGPVPASAGRNAAASASETVLPVALRPESLRDLALLEERIAESLRALASWPRVELVQ
ncbi:MAG: hypothetical protein ACUVQK_09860 [Thermogutta sp.]